MRTCQGSPTQEACSDINEKFTEFTVLQQDSHYSAPSLIVPEVRASVSHEERTLRNINEDDILAKRLVKLLSDDPWTLHQRLLPLGQALRVQAIRRGSE